jgi:uncharacterized membrane protein
MMKTTIAMSLICAVLYSVTAFQQTKKESTTKPAMAQDSVSYRKDVKPILKKYCLPCHTEDNMNPSELFLDTYEGIMKGGKHGQSVLPGKADSSLFIHKISLKPPFGDPMPLRRKTAFPDDTLMILKSWINQGAKKN